MKKSILVLIAATLMLASCSQYTCPTYSKAKAPNAQPSKQSKI